MRLAVLRIPSARGRSMMLPLVAVAAAALVLIAPAARAVGNTVDVTVPANSCLSNAHACVSGVSVDLNKFDAASLRGYSVTFTLTNLQLCSGLASIHRGSYLTSFAGLANTDYHVRNTGPGVYVIDEVILGPTCGPAAGGTLFTLDVASTIGDGVGTVTVTAVKLRDCNNVVIPAAPGASGSITIDHTPPVAIADLAATQVTSGNPAGSVTTIHVSYSPVEAGATVEVLRAGFGDYPEFAAGSVPSAAAAPGAPWSSLGNQPDSFDDLPTARDFYYYVAFVTDACGNVSAVSNLAGGALNYHLGDTSDGFTPGTGDNLVNSADVSLLGFNYGASGAGAVDPVGFLDFGPTVSGSVLDRPTPDDKIDFEDLILLAINYSVVSKPSIALQPAARDELAADVSGGARVGEMLSVRLVFQGTGRVQGLAARLRWNPAVVEPMAGVAAGEMLAKLGGVAMSARAGSVDAAVLGVRPLGMAGEGTLATLSFRRIGAGDPGIAVARVDARDALNRKIDLATGRVVGGAPAPTALGMARPNPFRGTTAMQFSLSMAGSVQLSIYSAEGRLVRTLMSDAQEAGTHSAVWDGLDQQGRHASPGVYYAQLVTQQGRFARSLVLLK